MPTLKVSKIRSPDGGQPKIEVVEQENLPAWAMDASLVVVGQPYPRLEGSEKVTGRARYSSDVRLPRQLYAKVLRSPLPHARIKRIATAKAEALPGVHAVLSSVNAPEIKWYEESVVFDRTVRMVGDEVAAVAAESEEIAEDALRLIEVEYEPLPFVTEIAAALRPDAPKLHDGGNIAGEPKTYERGDADAGLRQADLVVEATYVTQSALHNAMEPHGCTAAWEGETLTIWD